MCAAPIAMTVPSSSGRLHGRDFLNGSRFKWFVDVVLFSEAQKLIGARRDLMTGLELKTDSKK